MSPRSRDASSTAAPPSTGAATRTSSSCSAAATPTTRWDRRSSKNDALAKANRIPVLTGPDPLPAGATELQKQAHAMKGEVGLHVARKAVSGVAATPAAQQAVIDEEMAEARDTLTDALGADSLAPTSTTASHGTRSRCASRRRSRPGSRRGRKPSPTGATQAEADATYVKAHRRALGTPTVGGGTIPHFDHEIPPRSLGADRHAQRKALNTNAFGAVRDCVTTW